MAIVWSLSAAEPSQARSAPPQRIAIAAGTLAAALDELARETGISVGTEGALPPIRVAGISGAMSPQAALGRLLAGSGYVAKQIGPRAFRIERDASPVARIAKALPVPAPAGPPPAAIGEPIIVTATKREQPLVDLPLAVAVVGFDDSEAVRDAQPDTASVKRRIEGLALGGQGPGRNRLFLRGVADSPFTGSTQSTVAVVLDGARVTWSAPDPDLRLIDVARVEVIKGPQGALYGTGALGGIYRIVSNRPDPAAASARFAAGPDAVGGGSVGAHASGVVNFPVIRDRVAVRIGLFGAIEPGWIETGSREDSNRLRVGGGRAALRWDDGGWTADLAAQVQLLNSADSQYVYAPRKRSRPAQIAEPHDNDFTHVATEISGPVGSMQLHLVSAVTWHDVGETFDATAGAASFGLANPARFLDDRAYRVWDNEARLSGRWGRASWIVGLGHVEARERVDRLLESLNPREPALRIERIARTATDTALFGEATVPLGGAVSATLGARLYHDTINVRGFDASGATGREIRQTGVIPTASLSWRAGRSGLIYVRYGSAIRQGGLAVPVGGRNDTLEGDELRTAEVGLRRSLGRSGALEVAAYATDWKNLQTDLMQPSGLLVPGNAGRARILGAEARIEAQLASGWRISLGGAWQEALLIRNELGIELEDRRLPVVPLYTLRTRLEHGFEWLGADRATIAGELHYDGPSRLSFDPALDRPMGKVLDVRLGARILFGRWNFGLQVDNLLDSRANVFAYGNPFRVKTGRQFVPAAPPRAALTIGASF